MPPMAPMKIADRPGLIADNLMPAAGIGLAVLALALGWSLFSDRLMQRANRADAASADESRLWGGPLLQPHPSVRWRRADAATAELSSGEIARSDVAVDLGTEYRRRGLVEFPCYEAGFDGRYDFKNPSSEPAFVAFAVGMPAKGESLMLRDLKLLVDGKEDPAHTEYTPDRVVWTGQLAGNSTGHFELAYHARGLERFGYQLQSACTGQGCPTTAIVKPVTAFTLQMQVRGAKGQLDRVAGWMAPTSETTSPQGMQLEWSVDRLLTAMDLGVVLPDDRGISASLAKLMNNAPWFYLLYAAGLLYALASVPRRPRTVHVLGLSAGYFLYFPLATYLTTFLPWVPACGIAAAGVSALAIAHARQFVGTRAAALVALCQLFFLAVPAGAYLLPSHTGLVLVLAGFAVLGAGLQAAGHLARKLADDDAPVILPAMAISTPERASPVIP